MSKLDDALELYEANMKEKLNMRKVDAELLRGVAKSLGPSIYKKDASLVACSDPKELDKIKNNFLIKKLGLDDSPKLDKAIMGVCEKMGKSNRRKYRPIFYYLLVKKFKMEDNFKK